MQSNSTVELVKVPAPKGYAAKHVWMIVDNGTVYGEIVPDISHEGITGYTVFNAQGGEHYSLSVNNRWSSRVTRAGALSACKRVARNMVRWAKQDALALSEGGAA